MSDFLGLPFTEEAKEKIMTSVINYQRFAGVEIGIGQFNSGSKHFYITVEQTSFPTGRKLTQEEMADRVKEIFEGLTPPGYDMMVMSAAEVK